MAVPAAAGAAGTASLPNSHPTWATSGNKIAATAAGSRIGFSVYLKMRDQAGAEAVAAAVSDPNGSAYGHYLSPAQVRSRFAATDGTVRAVRNWLSSDRAHGRRDGVEQRLRPGQRGPRPRSSARSRCT